MNNLLYMKLKRKMMINASSKPKQNEELVAKEEEKKGYKSDKKPTKR